MASRKSYPCFVCQKAGFEVEVYLDGKDEDGNTIRKNLDMSPHVHKQQKQGQQQQQGQGSTTATVVVTEPTSVKIINAKLDRIISLLEKEHRSEDAR